VGWSVTGAAFWILFITSPATTTTAINDTATIPMIICVRLELVAVVRPAATD